MTNFGIYFTIFFIISVLSYFVYLYIDYKKANFNKELKDAETLINDEIKKQYSDMKKLNKLTLKSGVVRYIKKGKIIK